MPRTASLGAMARVGSLQALGYLATLAWNLLLARGTDLELYGKVSFAVALVLVLQVAFSLGGQRGLTRFLPGLAGRPAEEERGLRRRAALRSLGFGAATLALAMLLAVLRPGLSVSGLEISLWIPVLGAGLGASLLNLLGGWRIGRRSPGSAAFLGAALASLLLLPALALALATGRDSLDGLLWVIFMVFGGLGLVSALVLWGRGPAIAPEDDPGFRRFGLFARRSLVIALVALGLSYLDRLMLGAFGQFSELGVYNIAARLARVLFILVFLLNPIMGPLYAKNLAGQQAPVALRAYRRSSAFMASLTLPLGLLFILFGGPLLAWTAGEPYAAGASSLALLTVGAFALSFTGNNSMLLQMGGRESAEMRISLAALALNFLLNLLLIPALGALGAALATALSLVISMAGRSLVARRAFGVWPGGFGHAALWRGGAAFAVGWLVLDRWAGLPWQLSAALCLLLYLAAHGPFVLLEQLRSLGRALEREGGGDGPRPARLALIIAPAFGLRDCYRGQDEQLRRAGYSVTGIAPPGPEEHERVRARGMTTVAVPMAREARPLADLVSLARLWAHLLFHRYDIVQVSTPKAAFLGLLACRLTGHRRVIYLLRGRAYENFTGARLRFYRAVEALSCRLAARVVPVSRELGEKLVVEGLCPPGKLRMAGPGSSAGVDLEAFAPRPETRAAAEALRGELGLSSGDTAILYVGWLRREKGLDELVRAYRDLATERPGLRLLLAGGYYEGDAPAPETREAIEGEPGIHLLPWTEKVAPVYAAADLLAHPSWREGFPRVILEASASGLPVVTSDIPGCREAVVAGETGLLAPRGDAAGLAAALAALLDDPALRQRMGAAGREHVARHYAAEAIWREQRRIMDELLGEEFGRSGEGEDA